MSFEPGMMNNGGATANEGAGFWRDLGRRWALPAGVCGLLLLGLVLTVLVAWLWRQDPSAQATLNTGFERMYYVGQTVMVVLQTALLLAVIWQLRQSRYASRQQSMLAFLANRAQIDIARSQRYDEVDRELRRCLVQWRSPIDPKLEQEMLVAIWKFWSFQFGQYRLYLDGHLDDARYRFFLGYRLSEAIQHDQLKHSPQQQMVYNAIVAETCKRFQDPSFEQLAHLLVIQRVSIETVMRYVTAERARHWKGPNSDLHIMADLIDGADRARRG